MSTEEKVPEGLNENPVLLELKRECETVPLFGSIYWKLRCNYLEKSIDPTYSDKERSNCRQFYMILSNRER